MGQVRLVAAPDAAPGQPVVDFAEGMAVDSAGNAFVSVTEWPSYLVDGSATGAFGQVWKVAPDGTMTAYGPQIPVGEEWGFLTGIMAFDRAGALYVATSGQGTVVRLAPGGSRDVFAEGLL